MSTSAKTQAKIEKETAKLNALYAKREELDAQIKVQAKVVEELQEQQKSEKLNAVANSLGKSGVTVDALLAAVQSGNLYDIQDLIEKSNANKSAPTTAFGSSSPSASAEEDED